MKIQVRKNVFETNSSSVHTISISQEEVDYSKLANKEIKFGKPDYSNKDYWKHENWFQHKLDEVYDYMISGDSLSHFLWCKDKIEKCLEKFNIKVEFELDVDYLSENHYSEYEEVFDELFIESDDFDDEFIRFLFCEKSNVNAWDNNYYDSSKLPEGCKNFESWE